MKVIDLLNKIANGEEVPKKIKYDNAVAEYDEERKDYYSEGYSGLFSYTIPGYINDEVEIIEEDKEIEKLGTWFSLEKDCENDNIQYANHNFRIFFDKINEIIDYINGSDKE